MVFSLQKDGDIQITKNFKIKEFKCPGSDVIIIEPELIAILQDIRDFFNTNVNINSGYRTEEHNKKVGGSATSQHLKGRAADIWVRGVPCDVVATYLDVRYPNSLGIEVAENDSYLHVDIREDRWRAWTPTGGSVYKTVEKFYPKK